MTTTKARTKTTKARGSEASKNLGVESSRVETPGSDAVERTRTRRELRLAMGLPLIQIAARASVSESSARLYEADPSAVTSVAKRAALAAVYAQLEAGDIATTQKAG